MRILAVFGSATAAGTGVVYVTLISRQGGPVPWLTAGLVVAILVALTVLTAYGAWGRAPARRAAALWAAVPGFFGLGFLAAWSIGGLLLIGSLPTLAAAALSTRGVPLRLVPTAMYMAAGLGAWAAVLGLLLLLARAGSAG